MALSFADMRKRGKSAAKESLQKQLEKTQKKFAQDPRFWRPTFDSAGNSVAKIRFMPGIEEGIFYIEKMSWWFKGPGGWFKENSLKMMGSNVRDPIDEMVRRLWESKNESTREWARKWSSKKSYVANIYVKSDPANSSAENRVFLYEFPKAILDIIKEASEGTDDMDEEEEAELFQPFWLEDSRDFKLMIYKNKGNFNQYDKCKFVGKLSDLADTEDEMERLYNEQHSLEQFLAPDQFKTAEELVANFLKVTGFDSLKEAERFALAGGDTGETLDDDVSDLEVKSKTKSKTKKTVDDDDDDDDDDDEVETKSKTKTKAHVKAKKTVDDDDDDEVETKSKKTDDDDDDSLDEDEAFLDELLAGNAKKGKKAAA